MRNEKWYSLIEMVVVVVIIGILATIAIWRFSARDIDRYNAERCINGIYGELSSFFHAAATSKILTGDSVPEYYEIYNQGRGFVLSGGSFYKFLDIENNILCKNKRYSTKHVWNLTVLRMLPGFQMQGNKKGIEIVASNSSIFTGEIRFDFCSTPSEQQCEEFMKLLFDARTGLMKKTYCKFYNTDPNAQNVCKERTSTI